MYKRFIFALLCAGILCSPLFAQAPDQFDFQSLIRDAQGRFVANQKVGLEFTILQGNAAGPTVYRETGAPTTNANGLVTWTVGKNTTYRDFKNIDWSHGPYFLQTKVDPKGGTNYTMTMTTQLMSVPYALYANQAKKADTAVCALNVDTVQYAYSAGNYQYRIDSLGEVLRNLRLRLSEYHPEGFSVAPARQVKFYSGNLSAGGNYGVAPYTPIQNNQLVTGNPIYPARGETAFISEYAMTNNDYGVIAFNGKTIESGWWTLSATQWCYLLYYRVYAEKLWGKGKVQGISGLILLPDGWGTEINADGLPFAAGATDFSNDYSMNWNKMQALGAVFLPISSVTNCYATSSVGPSMEGSRDIAIARMCIGNNGERPYIATDSDHQVIRILFITINPNIKAYLRLVHDF